jgi:hypothetical protein
LERYRAIKWLWSWQWSCVAIVRRGRTFSGGAAVSVVGDVGADVTGRRGPSVAAP